MIDNIDNEEEKLNEGDENHYILSFVISCALFFGGLYIFYQMGVFKSVPPTYYHIKYYYIVVPLGLTYFINLIVKFLKKLLQKYQIL